MFIDEGSLQLAPHVQRTWAPRGVTPTLVHRARHSRKVSTIGAITISARRRRLGCYVELFQDESIRSRQVLRFVQQIRRHVRAPIIVIWDNLQAHKSKLFKNWMNNRTDVFVEYLPSYTPELNPVESLWSHAKCHRLANYCPDNTDDLYIHAHSTLSEYHQEQTLLQAFIKHTGLPMLFGSRLYQSRSQ